MLLINEIIKRISPQKKMTVQDIKIDLFDYPLPDEQIARHPLACRDACRLIVNSPGGVISHHTFAELDTLIDPSTLMIANETKVINARMEFFKATGSRIEIFLLEPTDPSDCAVSFATDRECVWSCMVGNRKRWKEGELMKKLTLRDSDGGEREVRLYASLGEALPGNSWEVRFRWECDGEGAPVSFASVVEAAGNIPIPPYLKREAEECDSTDYQTVYSRVQGSVAAPTAGLHFTDELLDRMRARGVEMGKVTLHVGAGTFQPVKSEAIGDHPMHTESIVVERSLLAALADALEAGRPVLAVGTTSVRTLESLPYIGLQIMRGASAEGLTVAQWMPYDSGNADFDTVAAIRAIISALDREESDVLQASTAIMIAPGFRWRIVDRLVTNFHQPKSTLLLLVSSFLNPNMDPDCSVVMWKQIYREALREGYRFLSYGDACLLHHSCVELPASKSMEVRRLILDQVADAEPVVAGDCDDTRYLRRAIDALRANVARQEGDEEVACIYIGDGAAPFRCFTALAASTAGAEVMVKASANLSRRPMAPLLEALRQAGASIAESRDEEGCLTLRISGRRLRGGRIALDPGMSSQFVSALLMASSLWEEGLQLDLGRTLPVSSAYIDMTVGMLRRYGGEVREEEGVMSVVPGTLLSPRRDIVEPDWSAAAFFYELALLNPGTPMKIARLVPPSRSLQGDAICSGIYDALGVHTEFRADGSAIITADAAARLAVARSGSPVTLDLGATPDLVPSLAVALTQSGITFRFRGVPHLRHKECDRMEALCEEFRKMGIVLKGDGDMLEWDGTVCDEEMRPVIDPHSDHRIAMAFGVLTAAGRPIAVRQPDVVGKSFPRFWDQLIIYRPK